MNHFGRRPSHPATIGSRVFPAKIMFSAPSWRSSSRTISTGAMNDATPRPCTPAVSVCGIGLTRSIWSLGTNASTVAVPRMNISAMSGVAMTTDCGMVRSGRFVSPAIRATNSNPDIAPNAILPKMLRLYSDTSGISVANGRYSAIVPRLNATSGIAMSAMYVRICATPPKPLNHFPRPSPRIATTTSRTASTTLIERRVPAAPRDAAGLGAQQVRQVPRDHDVERRHDHDREHPQVPRDEKSDELAERRLRPLIQPALERHAAVEVDDDGRLREVEREDREQPEHEVRRPELRRGSDPRGTDDEDDLHQDEIAEPELPA